MTSKRLEAFSDGVLAIIITIMVLELKVPKDYTIDSLIKILPTFISYFVSFLYVSVYWVTHHQLFKVSEKINTRTLWANLNLLFWLSIIPFTTSWIGDGNHHTDVVPVVSYGVILLMCHLSFIYLRKTTIKPDDEIFQERVYLNKKVLDFVYFFTYAFGLFFVIFNVYVAMSCFLLVGVLKVIELNYTSIKV